ncbi:hypothetical protein FHW02_003926 [Ochrobactrum sp. RH1CCR137]|nr:hypothetical protein [Ochrobactrum sp. RH1CCR137]MBA8857561.1 hypothetical protein [Ochrobactrum sp. RH1CCR134]
MIEAGKGSHWRRQISDTDWPDQDGWEKTDSHENYIYSISLHGTSN